MKKLIVSFAAAAVLSSGLIAGILDDQSAGRNSQTGCGLGSVIIANGDTALMLAFQATTNGTSGNQTFGITSGTSGCKKTKFVMNERAEEFVASNMDQLAKEISVGQGESLDTLAELLQVEDKEIFASALQANYNSIYTSQNVQMADVLDNIAAI
ncbi:MAG: hypothetical protein COA44_11380 [Arcobacter sp.]|nr:MAG: hypothetical protein COA44_11380 [Arcobacter sp.]